MDGEWALKASDHTASDISVGYNGAIWILGATPNSTGEYTILYYDIQSNLFVPVEGTACKLAIGDDG